MSIRTLCNDINRYRKENTMNENLKSYVCNYKIEYEVEVNPYTKVIIQTQRQEQIVSEPKDINEISRVVYDNEYRVKNKMLYDKIHSLMNLYHNDDYLKQVKTKLIDVSHREVVDIENDVLEIKQIMMIEDEDNNQTTDETTVHMRKEDE